MTRIVAVNLAILGGAFLYWLALEYLYARNFELYYPYEILLELSFLLFVLLSFNYTFKKLPISPGRARVFVAVLIPALLSFLFIVIIYFFGIDLHILVGCLLFPQYATRMTGT
ncbi:MAG: hypothetical protein RBR09_06840 [Desulfobulbaceae bacterium]|jgi:hypothetical protein|nr:hypothetical protein [Desulfobulbaceae bacterium]MDY0350954.1 hypothetical protein [Desulfobulbaceae bacterium]